MKASFVSKLSNSPRKFISFSLIPVLAMLISSFAWSEEAEVDVTEQEQIEVSEEGAGTEELAETTEPEELTEPEEQAEPEASMDGLKALVDDGSYEEAYAQGQEMLFDYEGEPEFDLLYGTAATEVGQAKEAIFIFERLLEDDPENVRYQLELGKAYYKNGDRDQAKEIFERVLISDQELPDNVETRIIAYLDAIASGSNFDDPAKAETLKGFVGIALGRDSNINSASDADNIQANFNGLLFPFSPKEESATYVSYRVAGAYIKPLSDRTAVDMKVYLSEQKNSGMSETNQGTVYFELGNPWRFEQGLFKTSLKYAGSTYGGDDLYDHFSLNFSWGQPVDWSFADNFSVGFSTGTVRYTSEANEEKDINPTVLTFGGSKQIEQFIHGVGIQIGQDDAVGTFDFTYADPDNPGEFITEEDIDSDHYSRSYMGLSYSLSYLYDSKTVVFGSLNYQSSDYDQVDPTFLNGPDVDDYASRDGTLTMLTVGGRYSWNKSLQFNAQVSSIDVSSDAKLYEYSKNRVEVGAGYQL